MFEACPVVYVVSIIYNSKGMSIVCFLSTKHNNMLSITSYMCRNYLIIHVSQYFFLLKSQLFLFTNKICPCLRQNICMMYFSLELRIIVKRVCGIKCVNAIARGRHFVRTPTYLWNAVEYTSENVNLISKFNDVHWIIMNLPRFKKTKHTNGWVVKVIIFLSQS